MRIGRHIELNIRGRRSLGWFASASAVFVAAMLLFLYFGITQALVAYSGSDGTLEGFMQAFTPAIIKSAVVVVALGLLIFFFAGQEYQTTFKKLFDQFVNDEDERGDLRDALYDDRLRYDTAEGLRYLEASVDEILNENREYRSQMDQQRNLAEENFIIRLMKSWPKDIPMTYDMADDFGINLHARNLQVVVFGVDENAEVEPSDSAIQMSHVMLIGMLERMLDIICAGHIVEIEGMVACLLTPLAGGDLEDDETRTELIRISKLVCQIATNSAGVPTKACFGSVCEGVAGVEQSFSEAVDLFQYTKLIGDDISVSIYRKEYSDESEHKADYYWFKKEMQFMNCIRAEDYLNASEVFCEMIGSQYIRAVKPIKLANYRMLGLISSMVDALDEICLTVDEGFLKSLDPWERILSCETLPDLRDCSMELFEKISEYSKAQQSYPVYGRIDQVVEYLKVNYADSNLSVNSVANHFGINPSYFSRSFKRTVGIGMSDYLQHIRVNAAKELMQDESLMIKDIAERVGFNNVLTMNRTFKKLEGTTAGRLRGIENDEG